MATQDLHVLPPYDRNRRMLSPLRAILSGALTVALLDGLDAIIFFGLRGATPARIFLAIAAGRPGPSGRDSGRGAPGGPRRGASARQVIDG